MTLPVDDMRWCRWCQQTRAVGHADCAGGPDAPPCPTAENEPCGTCPSCLDEQATDLGVTRSTLNGDPS